MTTENILAHKSHVEAPRIITFDVTNINGAPTPAMYNIFYMAGGELL